MTTKNMNTRIPEPLFRRLGLYAQATNTTKTAVTIAALERHTKDLDRKMKKALAK